MTTTIQKWGNSHGIRLPKHLLEALKWSDNETVELKAHNDRIVIERAEPKTRKSISELFEGYNEEFEPETIDWGEPMGREIW